MGITDSITDAAGLRKRIRFMSGIKAEEIIDTDLDLVISIATEWFTEQTGIAYVVASADAAYDNAVMYYSCYLASIAQNGMGIEQLRIGDVFISYVDEEPYQRFLELANEAIIAKQALSIQTSTYVADSTGDVDWKRNIDNKLPRGM